MSGRRRRSTSVRARALAVLFGLSALVLVPGAVANSTPQTIPYGPQTWSNTALISTNDDWSAVPGIVGYLGEDGLTTTATGVDPQSRIESTWSTTVDVNANQTAPNTFSTGGVTEFHIADPVVALTGSQTADAPNLVLNLDTTGKSAVTVSYNLRDIDGSTDNTNQQVALHYRVGSSGNFTNLPAGYIADATTGPSLATLVTPVSVQLPAAADNQPLVQVRIMTTNAPNNDEWVGVDDISVTGSALADAAPTVTSTTPANGATNVTASSNITINFSEPVNVAGSWFSISCGTSGAHTATVTGGPTTFTLDPDTDFAGGETCTVTVFAANVTDQDTNDPPDNMPADYVFSFTVAAADAAPTVTSTTPANGATNVALNTNITINFSEPVNVAGSWFSISCGTSGAHTATVTGGPTTFTLDPDTDFAGGETCTVTVFAANVTDQDTNDPPDNMPADYVFSFTTLTPCSPTAIHTIQGTSHRSPLTGNTVCGVTGIVTAKASNGFYMQSTTPDSDVATSEAIFVFTSSPPTANVGDSVSVGGTVAEFRPGGASSANLTTTELASPGLSVAIVSSGNPLPATTVIGAGGRVPPNMIIEDDTGPPGTDIEVSNTFDPAQDGIDFYESLEAMYVQVNNPVAVGPRNSFGEIPVLADDGAGASVRTARGGIVVRANDFNPERIILDDALPGITTPAVNVNDHLSGPAVGVMDYGFGNFKLQLTSSPSAVSGGLTQEITATPTVAQVAIGSYNVENLDPGDTTFAAHASLIVNNLKCPDILAVQEIQDNNGPTNDTTVAADVTYNTLITAIANAGCPGYSYTQIDPVDDQDGGEPGGNIRVGFLYRTDRGLTFVAKPGGCSTCATGVEPGGGLTQSPGRIDPTNSAFNNSRKPLAAEFTFAGKRLYLINNHFNSKGGDQPLFGRFQSPILSSEAQRIQQAQVVNNFVDAILAEESTAAIVVLGDLNDFEFSNPLATLKNSVLLDLVTTLPQEERYTYVFDGNSQALDHILVSRYIANRPFAYDIVHVNSEFANQLSDHEPEVLRFDPTAAPTAVTVRSLTAQRSAAARGVVLRWRTASEAGILGFNVYRGARKVNARLIRASGIAAGASYKWVDRLAPAVRGTRYRLQLVRFDGSRAWAAGVTLR